MSKARAGRRDFLKWTGLGALLGIGLKEAVAANPEVAVLAEPEPGSDHHPQILHHDFSPSGHFTVPVEEGWADAYWWHPPRPAAYVTIDGKEFAMHELQISIENGVTTIRGDSLVPR